MAAVRGHLRRCTNRVQAFAQIEMERARELVRSVFVSLLPLVFSLYPVSGGAPAHPLGVGPEVWANYVVVGSNH